MIKLSNYILRNIGPVSFWLSIILVVIAYSSARTQSQYISTGVYSLDVPADPQSIALGESFAGVRGKPAASQYNPASLTGLRGITFNYNVRNYDIDNGYDAKYRSYLLTLPIPGGGLGISYENYLLDMSLPVTTEANPEGANEMDHFKEMNYVFGLTYSRSISSSVDLGIAVKTFNSSLQSSLDGAPLKNLFDNQAAYLLDIGLLYHHAGPLQKTDYIDDEVTAGLSIQNFGTDYRENLNTSNTLSQPTGGLILANPTDYLVKLPRYARAGFSYRLTVLNEDRIGISPFSFIFTAEYRNLLNGTGSQLSMRDYWGFGIEGTLYELLSLRMGGYISPNSNIYGNQGIPSMRYGAGVNLPLRRIGANLPFTVHADYAGIPLLNFIGVTTTFKVYSIGITYNNSLF